MRFDTEIEVDISELINRMSKSERELTANILSEYVDEFEPVRYAVEQKIAWLKMLGEQTELREALEKILEDAA